MKTIKKAQLIGITCIIVSLMLLSVRAEDMGIEAKMSLNLDDSLKSISISGYIAGAAGYEKAKSVASDTWMDLSAAKFSFLFDFKPLTAQMNFYTDRDNEIDLLEAFVNYDFGKGFFMEAGRYQSWIGYEAFDIPDQFFITNGMADLFGEFGLALMPDVSEGVKVGHVAGEWTFAASFQNSVYSNMFAGGKYSGDGSLSDGFGTEWNVTYEGETWEFSVTLCYEHAKNITGGAIPFGVTYDAYVADVWAQCCLSDSTMLAAEIFHAHFDIVGFGSDFKNYFGLLMARQKLNDKWSLAGRLSVGKSKKEPINSDDCAYWMFAVAPTYEVTEHLSIVAEVSLVKYGKDAKAAMGKHSVFSGVQAVFKF